MKAIYFIQLKGRVKGMAQLFPSFEQINSSKVKPTEGELHFLHFLLKELDDSYEIYFQPFINGDQPDIVVMRKARVYG